MTASTGRWSDPAASRRAAGLAVMDGIGPAASVVTAPSRDQADQGVADQDVIDQLAAALELAGEPLRLGDPGGEVPQPLPVALVGLIEPACADLRSGRPVEDLGGRRLRAVVEVPQHHHRGLPTRTGRQR